MISRLWTATATQVGASRYATHFREHVLPTLAALRGYRGAMLLHRPSGDVVELLVVSLWESEDAIREFAGSNLRQAVVADEARALLETFDDTVRHYTIVCSDRLQLGN